MNKFTAIGSLMLAVGMLTGCGKPSPKQMPRYVQAQRAIADADFQTGAAQLEQLLRQRPDAAEVHLELAQLYDESLQEPFLAAWHYGEFLRLRPDSPEAAMAKAFESRARREALDAWLVDPATVATEPVLNMDGNRLQREMRILRLENARLRTELTMLQNNLPAAAGGTTVAAPIAPIAEAAASVAALPEGIRTYIVAAGDTPVKISKKMYGTGRYANLILASNRDTVKSERGLQIGQVLKIPPKPEE